MFFRSKTKKLKAKAKKAKAKAKVKAKADDQAKRADQAKAKSVSKAKSVGQDAGKSGASFTTAMLSSATSALNSVSDAATPKAASAATTAKKKSEAARAAAMDRTEGARAAAKDRTEGAREVARDRATQARDSAVSGLDKGIDSAVPVMQQGVTGVSNRVDSARDVIVEDVLPKLQELLGNMQTQKDEALATPDGAVAVATGAPKKEGKKGGFLIVFGLLAAIGAGVCYYLSQQSNNVGDDDTDPWAGTTDDGRGTEPVATAAAAPAHNDGVSTASGSGADLDRHVGADNHTATDEAGATAADATGADVNATDDHASDDHATVAAADSDAGTRVSHDEGTTESLDGHESDPDELPKMVDVDDVPGTDTAGQPGFGTDFSDDDNADVDADQDRPGEGKHRA